MATPSHTFVFADLAGFTALTEAHGDEAAADLATRYCEAVCHLLPGDVEHVKSIGDAVLFRAPDAVAAVRTALRVVHDVGGRPEFPFVRAGAHTGTAVQRHGDWFGTAVNVAARVTAAAQASELLATESTRAAVLDLAGVTWEPRGAFRLRNMTGEVQLFAAHSADASPRLPIDPVCHMAVDRDRAPRLLHDGVERRFCSQRCLSAFLGAPDLYQDVRRRP